MVCCRTVLDLEDSLRTESMVFGLGLEEFRHWPWRYWPWISPWLISQAWVCCWTRVLHHCHIKFLRVVFYVLLTFIHSLLWLCNRVLCILSCYVLQPYVYYWYWYCMLSTRGSPLFPSIFHFLHFPLSCCPSTFPPSHYHWVRDRPYWMEFLGKCYQLVYAF